MTTLILIAIVATYVWFWYTDRSATMKATGHIAAATGMSIKEIVRSTKEEADIAKLRNQVADKHGRVHAFGGRKAGIVTAKEFMDSVGINTEYHDNNKAIIAELKAELAK